jgi:hypothetical protein
VTDIGGLNDKSFNQLAYEGLQQAESELGVEIKALESKSNADYIPNLQSLAEEGYDLVIAVGFLMRAQTLGHLRTLHRPTAARWRKTALPAKDDKHFIRPKAPRHVARLDPQR